MAEFKNNKIVTQVEQFPAEVQKVLLSYMISSPDVFTQCLTIVRPEYFDGRMVGAVQFVLEYAEEFKTIPAVEQIRAKSHLELEKFSECSPQNDIWFLTEIEKFCRHKAVENTALDALDLIKNGEYGEYERRIKEAVTISLTRDLGTNYYEDPEERLRKMLDKSDYVSTGWETLDKKLYGGFQRGTLNVFAGGSGSGKSLFLQNLALNWSFAGLNVIYFSLELYEPDVALRMDAMLTGRGTVEVTRNIGDTALTVERKGHNSGKLVIKKLPEGGTTANTLRAFLKEYEIRTGIKPDAIIVDYLDLMYPNSIKVDTNSFFIRDKYTSEEMRALAGEMHCLCVTASQLNRQSVGVTEFDHSHIAGGISKINTADNVFAILSTAQMKEQGIAKIEFLKCRNSNATGHHLTLAYNAESMRISDAEPESENTERMMSKDEIKKLVSGKTTSTIGVPITPTEQNVASKLDGIMDHLNRPKKNSEL